MTFIPSGEKIIEKKICQLSGKEFIITDKDIEFYDKVSPVFGGKKYSIPSPALCPDERQKRRLAFRNERKLYKRKCDKTGQEIISIYSPDKSYTVYDQKVWWGDDWNACEYGVKFDFEKGFFEQFDTLLHAAPRINLINKGHENSEFCNFATQNNNSYLLFTSGWCENSYFSNRALSTKNVCDSSNITHSELCYEVIDSSECYNCKWVQNSHHCSDCFYWYALTGCSNCIGCYGLINKQFCIGNKQFDKETFHKKAPEILASLSQNKFQKHLQSCTRKYANIANGENSTWDALRNVKNVHFWFESEKLENCKYIYNVTESKDSYDINNDDHSELGYEVVGWESNYQETFSDISWFNSAVSYSSLCFHSKNLFGCSSLKNAHHCIFNTSYSVVEYEKLCWQIIDHMRSAGEWWEFFSHEFSPFWYNETVAQEYFPMTEEEVKTKGWNWYEGENKNTYIWNHYTPLPIREYDERIVGNTVAQKNIDEILAGIIQCELTGKPFKIIKQELAFYIENWIPIPTKHPDQRYQERMNLRNPRELYERACSECEKYIITTYASERPEKVLCEECYHKLVH